MDRRAYKREYYKEHKARLTELNRVRRLKEITFKQTLLAQFSCISCEECDPDIIDWHHVEPEDKKFEVSRWLANNDDWWSEVLKCVPLCCNCHRKIHKEKLCLIPLPQQMLWAKLRKKNRTESKPCWTPTVLCSGVYMPSVTTVLSATESEKSKAGLKQWQQRNPGALEEASTRGSAIHLGCENYLRGIDPGVPEQYQPFWDWHQSVFRLVRCIHWSERPLRPDWNHLRLTTEKLLTSGVQNICTLVALT